jgi:hypothetical protein
MVRPWRRCACQVDAEELTHRHRAYPMHHGSKLFVGDAVLRLRVFAGIKTARHAVYEEDEQEVPPYQPEPEPWQEAPYPEQQPAPWQNGYGQPAPWQQGYAPGMEQQPVQAERYVGQQPYQQPYQPTPAVPRNLTWKEFYDRFVSKKSKSYVTWLVVIFFFTAGLSAVLLGLTGDVLAVMDIAMYAIMGAALLASKHYIFAMIPTIYSAIFTVVGIVNGGTPSGIVALIVGACSIGVLQKAQKAYNLYKDQGIIPEKEI